MDTNYEIRNGNISDVGTLDLRFAKTPEDLRGIRSISDVGVILVPERLSGALAGIEISDIGSVVRIPDDGNVHCISGQTKVTGDALAAGDPEAVLIVVGQLMVTTVCESVGYKEIRVVGQLIATRGSEKALMPKLTEVNGQVLYIPADARLIMGSETIGRAFLELLPKPTPFVVMGELRVEGDVTVDLVREKIPEIVLMGRLRVPQDLVPLFQVLTVDKFGEIVGEP
ncbi:hypothetical protein BH11ARM2_BH11ARM2_10420 [soil metagenome]